MVCVEEVGCFLALGGGNGTGLDWNGLKDTGTRLLFILSFFFCGFDAGNGWDGGEEEEEEESSTL